ncbi:MAG: hypothetical protein KDC92_09280 [Bacteroidetes bacterium]|nr:hypothetical protein [Bacteroidota bacterium]
MKFLQLATAACLLSLFSCNTQCENPPAFATCQEQPDTGITCQAVFKSWIYDMHTGNCNEVTYSGCEAIGFKNQEECEECDCHRLESTNN